MNQNSDSSKPSLASQGSSLNTGGNTTWGSGSGSSSTPSGSGSTYNITNNNNINYNYGSNITAISNDGPVPTFQDIDKQRKKNANSGGGLGGLSSAIGSSGIGQSVSNAVTSSTYLTSASDTIHRTVGVDIRRAMGGKTQVEIAEERLRAEQAANSASGYGGGGYQGISIPIDYSTPS